MAIPRKAHMTPLWVISSFVSLTEVIIGVAVTQTTGGVQIALVVFVIAFPILVAAAFFAILWDRPHTLYPPSEFKGGADIESFARAMKRQSEQLDLTFGLMERAVESPEVERVIREQLSSGSVKDDNIDRVVSELHRVTEQHIRSSALSINIAAFTQQHRSMLLRPFEASQPVSDLLDSLYWELSEWVMPCTYGTEWVLRDTKTQREMAEMGRRWAQARGHHRDDRRIGRLGFHAGMELDVVAPSVQAGKSRLVLPDGETTPGDR